jgi:hypothetical protein
MTALIHSRFPEVADRFTFRKPGQCIEEPDRKVIALACEGMRQMANEVIHDLGMEIAAMARQDHLLPREDDDLDE